MSTPPEACKDPLTTNVIAVVATVTAKGTGSMYDHLTL